MTFTEWEGGSIGGGSSLILVLGGKYNVLSSSFDRKPYVGLIAESVVSRESALGDICVMTCTRAPSAGHSGGGSKQTRVVIMLITRRADAASPANSPDIVGSLPIRRVTPPDSYLKSPDIKDHEWALLQKMNSIKAARI